MTPELTAAQLDQRHMLSVAAGVACAGIGTYLYGWRGFLAGGVVFVVGNVALGLATGTNVAVPP